MDFNNIYITLAVVGVIKLIDCISDADYKSAAKIAGATIVGALIGHYVSYVELDGFKGALFGLSASGLITAASYLGSRSAVQVDKANVINTETLTEGKKKSTPKSR